MMKVVCGGNPDLLLNLVSITQCNVSMPYFFLGGIGHHAPRFEKRGMTLQVNA